ncbi:uncharacterized protein LOC127791686 [Diospyros lotus]|uniref:uncharacterized protein LOC127791686 n=1 Tax=Diospyros lotus TaxID=55363 RepID=UPI002255FF0E|nr:uncharacterized protein LOC127791686 [Diospyros lotus]
MSGRRGRSPARARGNRPIPIPVPAPPLVPTPGESSTNMRQEMNELRGAVTGMMRHFEAFMANQRGQGQVPQEAGAEPNPNPNERDVGQTSNLVTQEVEAQGNDGNAGSQLLKNFMALRPPEFHGRTDVLAAESWMLSMEKHLRAMGCNDAQKVQLATFLFRDDAERWWETTRQRYGIRGPTWAEFREVFHGTYFPSWVREQKTYEFIELTQGNKSVAQYEEEFISLARFAPDLVSTEEKKATKFQRGLRVEIRYPLVGARITDYATLVERAYTIENERNELRMVQAASRGASASHGRGNGKKRKWETSSGKNASEIPPCKICGKKHRDPCRFAKGVCYLCGQAGHLQKDCPQNSGMIGDRGVTCFECGRKGHKANVCRQPQ